MSKTWPLAPVNGPYLEKHFCRCSQVKTRSQGIRVGSNGKTGVLTGRGKLTAETHRGEGHVKTKAENEVTPPHAKERQGWLVTI